MLVTCFVRPPRQGQRDENVNFATRASSRGSRGRLAAGLRAEGACVSGWPVVESRVRRQQPLCLLRATVLPRGRFHWGITCGLFFHDVASLAGSHQTHAEIGCRDIDGYGASLESPPSRAVRPQAPAARKGLGGQDASRTECISRPAAHVRFATDNLRAAAPVEAGAGGGWLQRDARLYV